jgi:hypothetical protein
MLEFTSLKVTANNSADLATQLTSMSAQGWQVVSIVATGEIVAYLSRPVSVTATDPTPVQPTPVSDPVGWAATTNSPSSPGSFISPTPASSSTSTPTPSVVPSVPADWYKDPAGRYEFRYWDGSKWTENVSRAGVMYKDPPTK